jgi:hypothetical protein
MGSPNMGMSPILSKNSEQVPDYLLDGMGKSEAFAAVGEEVKVQAVDNNAKKDLGILHLQAVTRRQVRISAKELVPGNENLPGLLIKLIREHQEQDPVCKWIVRQTFHPRWQLNLALAKRGPGSDNYTVQTYAYPGGMRDLLCVVCCVIVPVQTSLCIELLC